MSSPDVYDVPQQLVVRQILFSFQLVPAGLTTFGLLTVKVPRWLPDRDHTAEAIERLAYVRCFGEDDHRIYSDMCENEDVIAEGTKEASWGWANFKGLIVTILIFRLQHWSGQSSVRSFATQISTEVRLLYSIAAPY